MFDIEEGQTGGKGLPPTIRASLAWDLSTQPGKFNLRISVYYESWRIDKSKLTIFDRTILMLDPADNIVETFGAIEPENRTQEIGITFSLTRF